MTHLLPAKTKALHRASNVATVRPLPLRTGAYQLDAVCYVAWCLIFNR